MTGELAVCGPGNLHLINGLFEANRSRGAAGQARLGRDHARRVRPGSGSRRAECRQAGGDPGRSRVCRSARGADPPCRDTESAGRTRVPRQDAIEYDNPYDVGMTGLIGFSSGYRAMEHGDACSCSAPTFRIARSSPRASRWSGRRVASTSAAGRPLDAPLAVPSLWFGEQPCLRDVARAVLAPAELAGREPVQRLVGLCQRIPRHNSPAR